MIDFSNLSRDLYQFAQSNPLLTAIISLIVVVIPLAHFVPSIIKGLRFILQQSRRLYTSNFEKNILLLMQHGAAAKKRSSEQIDGYSIEVSGAILGKDSKERKKVRYAIEGLLQKNLIEPRLQEPDKTELFFLTQKGKQRIEKMLAKSLE